MLEKIISGFQTGSDIAAIRTAKRFGIPTGGWIAKDFVTEKGLHPEYVEMYGAREYKWGFGYKRRTWKNVEDSDGTVIIAYNLKSPGSKCALEGIEFHKKPHQELNLNNQDHSKLAGELADFILTKDIHTLNVAGNRESTYPGIFKDVCFLLKETFEKLGFKLQ